MPSNTTPSSIIFPGDLELFYTEDLAQRYKKLRQNILRELPSDFVASIMQDIATKLQKATPPEPSLSGVQLGMLAAGFSIGLGGPILALVGSVLTLILLTPALIASGGLAAPAIPIAIKIMTVGGLALSEVWNPTYSYATRVSHLPLDDLYTQSFHQIQEMLEVMGIRKLSPNNLTVGQLKNYLKKSKLPEKDFIEKALAKPANASGTTPAINPQWDRRKALYQGWCAVITNLRIIKALPHAGCPLETKIACVKNELTKLDLMFRCYTAGMIEPLISGVLLADKRVWRVELIMPEQDSIMPEQADSAAAIAATQQRQQTTGSSTTPATAPTGSQAPTASSHCGRMARFLQSTAAFFSSPNTTTLTPTGLGGDNQPLSELLRPFRSA